MCLFVYLSHLSRPAPGCASPRRRLLYSQTHAQPYRFSLASFPAIWYKTFSSHTGGHFNGECHYPSPIHGNHERSLAVLVLSRRINESIVLPGRNVTIRVVAVKGGQVR